MKTFKNFLVEAGYRKKPPTKVVKVVNPETIISKADNEAKINQPTISAPINGPLRLDKQGNSTKGITENDKASNAYLRTTLIDEKISNPIYVHHHFINGSYNNLSKGRNAQKDELMYDDDGNSYSLAYKGKDDHVAGWQHLINNPLMKNAFEQIALHTFDMSNPEKCYNLIKEIIQNPYPYGPRYFIKVENMYQDKPQFKYQAFIYTMTFFDNDSGRILDIGDRLIKQWKDRVVTDYLIKEFLKNLRAMFWTFYTPKSFKDKEEAKSVVSLWDQPNSENINKGIIMFNESVKAQEQRFLTEGTSIDAQGNAQSLSEEQQHWLRENLEEIKKANDDTVPVHSLFLDFSDYREIDKTHYYLGGKIHESFSLTKEEMKKELTHSSFYYHLNETREWVDKAIKEGRDSWENMPLWMRDDQRLCLKACGVSMFHEDVVSYLKKERAKIKKRKLA